MTDLHRNLIGGEWVAGASATANLNPSDVRDVIGEYAQADAGQTRAAIAAASQAFPGWATGPHPGALRTSSTRVGSEILARKDELGHLLSREEGKTLPEAHRRGGARRPDLQVLRRRGAAPRRRQRSRRCGPASTSR